MVSLRGFAVSALLLALPAGAAFAHSGGLDGNGCHYEGSAGRRYHCHQDVKPNPDVKAPAKKSRENVCHDRSSPNYSTVKFFVSYKSMAECLASGGRAPG